jgi:5-methyltetrahydropteroyltriglutamate--homocysteine methyltransferase
MQRSTDRILTTHVGSLPRPAALRDALRARHFGQAYDEAAFARLCADAVNEAVAQQVAAGIDIVSDGEMSKAAYTSYVKHRMSGFSDAPPPGKTVPARPSNLADWADHPDFMAAYMQKRAPATVPPPCCTGPLSYTDRRPLEFDLANLKDAVQRGGARAAFMTAATPGVLVMFQPNAYYSDEDSYVAALADAMRTEYEAIHRAGFILQLDAPDLAVGRLMWPEVKTDADFIKIAERNLAALNHATANIPPEAMRLHICWGNYHGPHTHDFPVAKLFGVLAKARPQALSFEGANPRHDHEWEDWRSAKLPDDKILIPGVIDSTVNFVEHPRLVAQRIARYADIVGRERVIAGVDCGFGTFGLQETTVFPSIVWSKLKALSEGARMASERLWRPRA